MISTTDDIKEFINDKGLKKIFVLCGKKSFVTSIWGGQLDFVYWRLTVAMPGGHYIGLS